MTNYWPSGLDLDDTAPPLEILESAKQEWAEQSDGVLTLVIQIAESANKNYMLIVHAKHVPSNRTVTLFSVVHRPGAPYPARIQPRDDELPDILKKSYYRPGIADITAGIGNVRGREVTNKWVCDTPFEFRSKLTDVFNLGTLKADVVSLVAGSTSSEVDRSEDVPEGEPDDMES